MLGNINFSSKFNSDHDVMILLSQSRGSKKYSVFTYLCRVGRLVGSIETTLIQFLQVIIMCCILITTQLNSPLVPTSFETYPRQCQEGGEGRFPYLHTDNLCKHCKLGIEPGKVILPRSDFFSKDSVHTIDRGLGNRNTAIQSTQVLRMVECISWDVT
jgi:hypothetical protein